MKNLKQIVLLGLTATVMVACNAPQNGETTGVPVAQVQPEKPVYPDVRESDKPLTTKGKTRTKDSLNMQGEARKKMDILFVIDDSKSMCGDQRKLKANISKFVNVFVNNTRIDFQIGVTSSWDTRLFGNATRKYKNGELRRVYGQNEGMRYITNDTPNLIKTLNETIDIGYLDFNKANPSISGSENEEFFSPIMAAFSDEMLSGANRGFSRPDADKGIIIITDADDGTADVSAQMVTEFLAKVGGGQNVTVLGAFSRLNDMNAYEAGNKTNAFTRPFKNGNINACGDYTIDPGLVPAFKGPARLNELVKQNNGNAFDLNTTSFGDRMADMGKKLVNRALSYRLTLKNAADVSEPILVKLNGRTLDKQYWGFDADSNQIVLSESLNLSNVDNFKVDVEYSILD